MGVYITHSAKGTSWTKDDHKYTRREPNGLGGYRYYYTNEDGNQEQMSNLDASRMEFRELQENLQPLQTDFNDWLRSHPNLFTTILYDIRTNASISELVDDIINTFKK